MSRVACTEAAAALIRELLSEHGPLMFHQSGGCCDGSAPMCYPRGDFLIGERDILLGEIEGCPFYIGADLYERLNRPVFLIDAVPGRGAGFSLEGPTGKRFLTRSEICTPERA